MPSATRGMIIRRLREHLDELESFTDGLTEDQLKERPRPAQRSLYEIALHLGRVQDAYIDRVAVMLMEKNPVLESVSLNGAPIQTEDGNPQVKLRSYIEQRKTLVALLGSLDDRQWKMEGKHPHVKNYTIEKCMEELMRHEECHLFEMFNVFFGYGND